MTSPSCDTFRLAGNQAFSKKDYDTALSFYSQAISLALSTLSSCHVHYSNRSLCYYVMEEYKLSMFDAMEAVKGHPPVRVDNAREMIEKGENVIEKLDADEIQRIKGFFR